MIFAIIGAAAFACQEPDPNYGDPNGIWGKLLPGEKAVTGGTPTDVPTPTTTLKAEHAKPEGVAGGAPLDKVNNCLACHVGNPGKKFSYGGRVEVDDAGVAGVIVSVDGLASVKTDADGYFWLLGDQEVAKDSKTRVQQGDKSTAMSSVLGAGATGGGCLATGACHGGSQPPIHP